MSTAKDWKWVVAPNAPTAQLPDRRHLVLRREKGLAGQQQRTNQADAGRRRRHWRTGNSSPTTPGSPVSPLYGAGRTKGLAGSGR